MNSHANPYAPTHSPVATLDVGTRATFIARTYAHLLGAIGAFTILEMLLFTTGFAEKIAGAVLGGNGWFVFIIGFMLVSWMASRFAHRATSLAGQYTALGIFVAAWSVVFAPLLYIAAVMFDGLITNAAAITLGGFSILTLIVFVTRKDFSFLRSFLVWMTIALLIAVLVAWFVGVGGSLGIWISIGFIVLAGAAILYDTSNVLHHFPEDRYVGASLELFASVAMLFWHVIVLLMRLQQD